MKPVEPQPVAVVGAIGHGQAIHDAHVVPGMTVVATMHVVTAVSAVVRLVPSVHLASVVPTVMIHVSAVAFGCFWAVVRVMCGVLGCALPAVIGMLSASTIFVVAAVLLARAMVFVTTVMFMRRGVVVALVPTVCHVPVAVSVTVKWRFPVSKLSDSAVEGLDGLSGFRDRHLDFGGRDGAP